MQLELVNPQGRSLLIVVPAWQRFSLSRICFAQLRHLCDTVAGWGLDARVVVVADDDNLDLAADTGHLTIEHKNQLGAKLNAGYYLAHEQRFDYVCAVGSDSWMHPDRLRQLPDRRSMLCTRNYVSVSADGGRQAWVRMRPDGGIGTRITPVDLLANSGYRPLPVGQTSGCDTATWLSIVRGVEQAPNLIYTDWHPFEMVGFCSADVQITRFAKYERSVHEWMEPFSGLADHFPAELVDMAREHYGALVAAA